MKSSLIVMIIVLLCFDGLSQQPSIDSLKQVFATTKSDSIRAWVAMRISANYSRLDIDSAIYYARLSVNLATSLKNQELEFWSRQRLGRSLSETDIPESMKEYLIALRLAEKLNNENYIAASYRAIGQLHLYLGNNNKYIDYLKTAVEILKKQNDLRTVLYLYAEIGGSHPNQDSARHYLSLAATDSTLFKSAYYNYYWGRNETDPQKALAYFLESIRIAEEENDLRGLSLASRWLSIFYQNNGDLNSGILAAKKGLSAAQQIKLYRGIINNSEQLAFIYKNLNQIDSAYKYQSIMLAAKDSLLGTDKINQIQNSIIEEQQRVLQLQAEKNELKTKIKLYVALGIAAILLLLILIFYNNHLKTKKSNALLQKQRAEIDRKNKELQQSLDTLKSTQAQLVQQEKLASLGELTAGIAHEIQNPLNFVNNFSEVSKELIGEMNDELTAGNWQLAKEISADIEQNLEKINHHGKRADAIVKGMLQHSRTNTGQKELTDINALADEYLRLSYHGLRAKDKSFNADFKTELDPNLPKVEVVPQDIGRVLLNLINNAFYAVDHRTKTLSGLDGYKPTVTISTKNPGDRIEISVKDNGPGIPEEIKNKIFQPFFTTKPTGQGTGLGLSLSYDIVKAHGGELKVDSKENEGTTFTLTLPL